MKKQIYMLAGILTMIGLASFIVKDDLTAKLK